MILAVKMFPLILLMKIFLVALQPMSLVHSLHFEESGSITQWKLQPDGLLFFSCVLK